MLFEGRSPSRVWGWVCVAAVMCAGVMTDGSSRLWAQEQEQPLNIGGIDQSGGTIEGLVKFDGRQAKRKPVRMGADPYCDSAHKDHPPLKERYVFGDNDTLTNVFVWISKGLEGQQFATPSRRAVIDQQGCVYHPHVSGVVVGQTVEILNSDNTLHNVNCQPKANPAFNEGMPVKGMVSKKRFTKPEMAVPLKCDVHPWMQAYLHVMEHPFFAVTQADGTFKIQGLPPGQYTLSVWHEFGKFAPDHEQVEITITEGQTPTPKTDG